MRSPWIEGRTQIQRLAFLRERREGFETKRQMRRPWGERQRLLCHHKPKNSRCDRYGPFFCLIVWGEPWSIYFFLFHANYWEFIFPLLFGDSHTAYYFKQIIFFMYLAPSSQIFQYGPLNITLPSSGPQGISRVSRPVCTHISQNPYASM